MVNHYGLYFVVWNVFLALLPCWAVYFLSAFKSLRKNRLIFALIFLFWLGMLPNTAYLFFMVRHLVDYCPEYDAYRVCLTGSWTVLFFFTYALIGLPTFYYSLNRMTEILKRKWLPLVMVPLTSVGLMFGLYNRYNSWDLLIRPRLLLDSTISYFVTPVLLTDLLAFTLALFLIYYVTDFFWQLKK